MTVPQPRVNRRPFWLSFGSLLASFWLPFGSILAPKMLQYSEVTILHPFLVTFVGVCVLIVVVTCSMMVFPFISSAFPFGMGCIWVCRWPLWRSVWLSLGPFLGPVYVARAAFSCNELVPPGGTTTLHVARAVPPGGTTTLHKSGSTGTGNESKLRA